MILDILNLCGISHLTPLKQRKFTNRSKNMEKLIVEVGIFQDRNYISDSNIPEPERTV